jgi:hypothetical protein
MNINHERALNAAIASYVFLAASRGDLDAARSFSTTMDGLLSIPGTIMAEHQYIVLVRMSFGNCKILD